MFPKCTFSYCIYFYSQFWVSTFFCIHCFFCCIFIALNRGHSHYPTLKARLSFSHGQITKVFLMHNVLGSVVERLISSLIMAINRCIYKHPGCIGKACALVTLCMTPKLKPCFEACVIFLSVTWPITTKASRLPESGDWFQLAFTWLIHINFHFCKPFIILEIYFFYS